MYDDPLSATNASDPALGSTCQHKWCLDIMVAIPIIALLATVILTVLGV